jgi:Pentapeptide repeats (8 copies)
VADDGNQRRKTDFRTAVEDIKALAKVLLERLSKLSPAALFAIGVVGTLVLALVVVIALLSTGDAQAVSHNAPLIAAVIALGGVGTAQMVSIALEDRRTYEARELEDRRTLEARDLEAQRAGEAALQNYFEQVGKLLIEQPLHVASTDDHLSTVVRAQTLSVLEGLDPERKRILLLFLYESGLIDKDKPVVSLSIANLREANLGGAYLRRAYLRRAYLSRGDLFGANLIGADLFGAALFKANLGEANLSEANLRVADLIGADLGGVYLRGANLSGADLSGADLSEASGWTERQWRVTKSLEGATMPNGQKYEDWRKDKEGRKGGGENG